MAIIDFFKKGKRNVIEELEEDAKEDILLIKEILELHSEKLIEVKELVSIWETGKNTERIDSIIPEIKSINRKLLKMIEKILELETKEESIVKLLLARNAEPTGLEVQKNIELLLEKLEGHLRYFHDILINLEFLLGKQNNYINYHWSGQIVEDLEKHHKFYYMLENEATLEGRLNNFILMVENKTRYLLNLVEKEPEGIINFEEVFSPKSPDLIKLYDEAFKEMFSGGDLLEFEELEKELNLRYKKMPKTHYHVLLVKIGPLPVGAVMFDLCLITKSVCVGAIYYFFLHEKSIPDIKGANKISSMLFEVTKKVLTGNAKRLGYENLSALIAEVDNPERKAESYKKDKEFTDIARKIAYKMKKEEKSNEEIKKEIEGMVKSYNSYLQKRSRLIRIAGFRKADFTYVVSNLDEKKCMTPAFDVKYLDFFVKPEREKWKSEMKLHSSEFLPILRSFIQQGYELLSQRPDLYDPMEKEIVKKRFVQLV